MSSRRDEDKHLILQEQPHQSDMFPMITASSNPLLAGSHLLLKTLIVAAYLIVPLFTSSSSVLQFVIIAAALDFWIVKNVSGRILVGLRWWVDFDQQGEEHWKFECKVDQENVNPANEKIFWYTLVIFSLVWILLTVINVFKLDITQITICLFCGVMLIFNLYNYYRCSKAQKDNVEKLKRQYGPQALGEYMAGSIIANYF